MNTSEIKTYIKDVPDFPKAGVIFKDITPLLASPKVFEAVVEMLADSLKGKGITKVLGMESRGFIFAAPVALRLNAGFVPVRKKGKLPRKTVAAEYALEYGTDILEMHADAIKPGEKVAIVDDVLATGGTCAAVADLVKRAGGELKTAAFLISLDFLNGRAKLPAIEVKSLLQY